MSVCLYIYLNLPVEDLQIVPIENVDFLVWGKQPEEVDLQNLSYISIKDKNLMSQSCNLIPYADTIQIPIKENPNGQFSIQNPCEIKGNFSLNIPVEDLPVNIDYNASGRLLSFYSPEETHTIDNQIVYIEQKSLATYLDVQPDEILHICDDYIPLNEYRNTIRTTLGHLSSCNVEVLSSEEANLIANSEFDDTNWTAFNEYIEPIFPGRIAKTGTDRNFSAQQSPTGEFSKSVLLHAAQESVYIAKIFKVTLEQFDRYFLSFNYSSQLSEGNLKFGYRLTTDGYTEQLNTLMNEQNLKLIEEYVNNQPYPTNEVFVSKIALDDLLTHRNNTIIVPTLSGINSIAMFLSSESSENKSDITISDLKLSKARVTKLMDFYKIGTEISDTNRMITLAKEIRIDKGTTKIDSITELYDIVPLSFNYDISAAEMGQTEQRSLNCPIFVDKTIRSPSIREDLSSVLSNKLELNRYNAVKDNASDDKPLKTLPCTIDLVPVNSLTRGNYILAYDYEAETSMQLDYYYSVRGTNLDNRIRNSYENSGINYSSGFSVIEIDKRPKTYTHYQSLPVDERRIAKENIHTISLLFEQTTGQGETKYHIDNFRLYRLPTDVYDYQNSYFEYHNDKESVANPHAETGDSNKLSGTLDVSVPGLFSFVNHNLKPDITQGDRYITEYSLNGFFPVWLLESGAYKTLSPSGQTLRTLLNTTIILSAIGIFCLLAESQLPAWSALLSRIRLIPKEKVNRVTNFISHANKFLAEHFVLPACKRILRVSRIDVETLRDVQHDTFDKAYNTLAQMFVSVVSKPIFLIFAVTTGMLVSLLVKLAYGPFVTIFFLWLLYHWKSRILAFGAMVQFILVCVLTVFNIDRWPEWFAISTYLFLVMTVVMQILEYRERCTTRPHR